MSVEPNATILQHCLRPHNPGDNPHADGCAQLRNECGELLEIWLQVRQDKVVRAGFWAQACTHVVACGSAAAQLAEGLMVFELKSIDAQRIDFYLGGLPPAESHCARFASEVLKCALHDYLKHRREDAWKRIYRS